MKTEKFVLLFLIVLFCSCLGNVRAQDYLLSFTGSGATTIVSTVKVENLTQGTSLTMSGGDVLHLVNSTTGIEIKNQNQLKQITFSPNPMTEFSNMQFELPKAGKTVIELIDISGRKILTVSDLLSEGQHTYRVQGIDIGIYIVIVSSDNFSIKGRLVCSGSTNSDVKIVHENTDVAQEKTDVSKGLKTETVMQYNSGDRLKLTGISGNNSTIVTDTPEANKTINFNFIACTDADANNYPVVQIGNQIWMAENLKTTKYRDGLNVTNITDNTIWYGLTNGAYCWMYNDAVGYKVTYGGLYNWYAIATRRLCPIGWHVPSDDEWTTLITFLGDIAGAKLKETTTAHWTSPNAATNETGFSARPGGYRQADFLCLGTFGVFWTTTEKSLGTASWRFMQYIDNNVTRADGSKLTGTSVRCLKDKDDANPPPGDWTINTGFGKLVFTVDVSRTTISKMAYEFSNYKCGPVTLVSGGITFLTTPPWPITDGYFSITNRLDSNGEHLMTISGTYSFSGNKFVGTWSDNSYGTICTGTWEASAPK